MRHRKPANIEFDLRKNAVAIIKDPKSLKGTWIHALLPDAREVRLDLGCGKGAFLAQIAKENPSILFVGIDNSEICVARCAERLLESGIANAFAVHADASDLAALFAPMELSRIYLNFNSPFPAKKYASLRLTHLDRLMLYRELIGEDGIIDLRTDHEPYWNFTLGQFELAGYRIFEQTLDLHDDPKTFDYFKTEYDNLTTARGARIRALRANPGPVPVPYPEQNRELGLVSYLPDDLEALTEIPYGMEGTIENMRNRRRNASERQKRHEAGIFGSDTHRKKHGA